MPLLSTINVKNTISSLNPVESITWWDPAYPYRIPVVITVPLNVVSVGEVIGTTISVRHLEMNKIKPDLSNLQVAYFKDGEWIPAATQAARGEDVIYVDFQTVDSIGEFDVYYIYYGMRGERPADYPEFEGVEYTNSIDLTSMYVSYTNPTQDWDYGDGYIDGDTPGAKIFVQMSVERFKLRGRLGPDGGKIRIYINDLPHSTVDLYNEVEVPETDIFIHNMVTPGNLELRIEVLSEKNEMSTGNRIRISSIMYDTYSDVDSGAEEIFPKLSWISKTGAM